MTNQLRELWYRGHVQGVGFRYTAAGTALRYPITGYVENLPDGRVHLVCEGTPTDLDRYLEDIAQRMEPFIREVKQDKRPGTGHFNDFEIRH